MKEGTKAYKDASKAEEAGVFTAEAVVYAARETEETNPDEDWFVVAFHTWESAQEQSEYTTCYVQRGALTALTEDELDELEELLEENEQLEKYKDHVLPVAKFEAVKPEVEIFAYEIPEDFEEMATQPVEEDLRAGETAVVSAYANKDNVVAGEKVIITAKVTNAVGTPVYQWQKSLDGESWSSTTLNGNKTTQLSFAANESRVSYMYRCRVIDDNGTWFSGNVKVNLVVEPVITAEAEKTEVTAGEKVIINVTATGVVGTPTYQWQKSSNGESWSSTTLNGNKTAQLSFAANESRVSYQYRCRVIDDNGTWYSNPVQVIIVEETIEPVITAEAEKTEVADGEKVIINVTATDIVGTPTYQWQRSSNGESWSSTTLTGNKTAQLSFFATDARVSYQYRCRVTDDNGAWFSNPVQVTIVEVVEPVITAEAEKAGVAIGEQVVINVTVTDIVGTPTYQWQRSQDGESWSNTTLNGNKTEQLSFPANATRLSYQYRCRVIDDNGTWFSNPVQVIIAPTVTAEADKTSAYVGEKVIYTVTTSGTVGEVTYQWQRSQDGENWSNTTLTGNKTAEMSLNANATRLSYQYRCAVTDENGTWFSNGVQVVLAEDPEVALEQTTVAIKVGDEFALTATVTPETATVTTAWTSDDETVATVSDTGVVTAVAEGSATITVPITSDKGVTSSATCAVTVYPDDGSTSASLFTFSADGLITGYTGTEGSIVLPRITADGQIVTGVAEGAFQGNAAITSVVVPEYIPSIGANAFEGCANLTSAQVLNTEMTLIPDCAFANCTSLTTVTLPNSIETIAYRAFYNCTSLAEMTTIG